MEGKLSLLFFFVILNNAFSSPLVSSQSNVTGITKTDINTLGQKNLSRRYDDGNEKGKLYYEQPNAEHYEIFERPLSVGDTFTPSELLPVAQKLIAKVDYPGQGKGIVSGAKCPEALADKLFEAFFFSNKRIVQLDEQAVSGLDALQALALSGEATYLREHKNVPVTEASDQATLSYKGQIISINREPVKSKYRLLTKKDNKKIIKKIVIRRGGIKLAQKLWKKRHLIMNPRRKLNSTITFSEKGEISKTKIVTSETGSGSKKQGPFTPGNNKTFCHWKYECTNPSDLDSCHIKTECNKKTPIVEFHGVQHLPDEHTKSMRQFRKMLGISLVDEEVEKILERRYIKIQPLNGRPGPDIGKVESLSEYFNNVIMENFKKSTEPFTGQYPTTEEYRSYGRDTNYAESRESELSGAEDRRRIFATPTRSTPKPLDHKL